METAAVRGSCRSRGQHQVGASLLGGLERLHAVAGHPDVVARGFQLDLEQAGDERVVVDDQQALAAAGLRQFQFLLTHADTSLWVGDETTLHASAPGIGTLPPEVESPGQPISMIRGRALRIA